MLENISPVMIALFQVDFTLSTLIKPEFIRVCAPGLGSGFTYLSYIINQYLPSYLFFFCQQL